MSDKVASYRRILKSSSIIGGASVINIVIGLVRTKIIAVLLGPAGIGLVSLYSGLMSTATAVATMGIGTIGTRQIAPEFLQAFDCAPGAVPQNGRTSGFFHQNDHRFHHRRVSGDGLVRGFGRKQVGFEQHFVAGLDEGGHAAQKIHGLFYRGVNFGLVIG